jgi:hypothetical protein
LGQVNQAERLALEAFENEGENPETLRLLAQINILKDRPAVARVYLHVLALVPFQREWAERRLRELETNPTLAGDAELDKIRSRLVKTDMVHFFTPTEFLLNQLLEANPQNQMAFDYLMSFYLLCRQGDKFMERLNQLNDSARANLPRNWEEAVLCFQRLKGDPADLHGRQVRPETLKRFQQYCQATAAEAARTADDRRNLAGNFRDTYWYYHDFGSTH